MVVGLVIIATVTIGVKTEIKSELIEESGLLDASLLGWQLLYILPVAILTNDFFLSSFWLRTFSSKTDKDLRLGVSMATVVILCIITLVGCTGLIAAWSGAWPGDPPQAGSVAFFLLLEQLPSWVIGIVLVMVVSLSTAAFDSLQSAMVSSASNDLFRNRLNIWIIRGLVVLIIIPIVVLALKAPSILQIFLISDLVSAATIPVLCLGLLDFFWFWRGFEFVVGSLGGILTVFIFGTIYYGSAEQGGKLILVEKGLYSGDWGVFGAFVAAPVGGIIWGFIALGVRLAFQFIKANLTGTRFDALDRPLDLRPVSSDDDTQEETVSPSKAGKFF
jgi:Na+/proline symporter